MLSFTLSSELQYMKVLNLAVGATFHLNINDAPEVLVFQAHPNEDGVDSLQVTSYDGKFAIPSTALDLLGDVAETITVTIWQAHRDGSFTPRVKGEIRRVVTDETPDPVTFPEPDEPTIEVTTITHGGEPLTFNGATLTFPTNS